MKLFRLALVAALLVFTVSPTLHAADTVPVVGQAQVSGKTVPCYQTDNTTVVCTPDIAGFHGRSWIPATMLSISPAGWYVGAFLFCVLIYLFCGLNIVDQWDRRPMKRFGKYTGTLGPGGAWREPFTTRAIDTVSIRDQFEGLGNKNSVQTHDNVPITFRILVTFRIATPVDFCLNVESGYEALWARTRTSVAGFIGSTELDSILHDRTELYSRIQQDLQASVKTWGIEVIAIELRDISIADATIQEAIAMKARAQKEAEAELVRAQMQTVIAQELSRAGAAYDEKSWKLKSFETLLELCRSAENNTILVPNDLMSDISKLIGKKS